MLFRSENPNIVKVMWGADGDLVSLRFQHNLGASPCNVVDVQLAHSSPSRRLGMQRALARMRSKRLDGLPHKEGHLDFTPRMYNRRILPFPLSLAVARYSMDDLHRIEALVCDFGVLPSLKEARQQIDAFLLTLPLANTAVERLHTELNYLRRKFGQPKAIKAVEVLRYIIHIKLVFDLNAEQLGQVQRAEKTVMSTLRFTDAVVPVDLSFAT